MINLSQNEISKKHTQLIKICEGELDRLLQSGLSFFNTVFPNATIKAQTENGIKEASSTTILKNKTESIKVGIRSILDQALHIYKNPDQDIDNLPSIRLTPEMSSILIETLVKIFSYGKNLDDMALSFISSVCESLNIAPREALLVIEQIQYEIRKEFFDSLLDHLSEEQCDLCAILLLKAIRADERIHPAEIKFFENVSQILRFDQTRLEAVEQKCDHFDFNIPNTLNEEISIYVFQYLVEIVMCDRKYDPRESRFIQDVAAFFNFNKSKQDLIIQPVASMLMLKAELFQPELT